MKRRRGLKKRYGRSKKWSSRVTANEHYHTPPGLFTESAERIAHVLHAGASDTAQAVRRLSFYINRAGKNLSIAARRKLHKAMRILEGKS